MSICRRRLWCRSPNRILDPSIDWHCIDGRLASVLLSFDFIVGTVAGVAAGVAAGVSRTLADQVPGTLLVLAQILGALAGIVLAAHAIVVSLINPEYMLILEQAQGGIRGVSKPYQVVVWVATAGVLAALLGGFLWPALPDSGHASRMAMGAVFGVPIFLGVWGLIGTAQLARQSAWHLEQRALFSKILREVREDLKRRNADG